jgi:hypothetical protein
MHAAALPGDEKLERIAAVLGVAKEELHRGELEGYKRTEDGEAGARQKAKCRLQNAERKVRNAKSRRTATQLHVEQAVEGKGEDAGTAEDEQDEQDEQDELCRWVLRSVSKIAGKLFGTRQQRFLCRLAAACEEFDG